MKKLLAILLLLSMMLGLAACGGGTSTAPQTPETPPVSDTPVPPAEPEIPTEPETPKASVVATVVTGDKVVEAATVEDLVAALDSTGLSVVTLQQDITTDSAIVLPYCCTFDFGGFTVRTNPKKGNGIQVEAVGTENKISTFKNGTLIHYDAGIRLDCGGVVVENMNIHADIGAPISFLDVDGGKDNVIRGSLLTSKGWSCFGYNRKNGDFSNVSVTFENSTLVSYKNSSDSTSAVFGLQAGVTVGELVFGDNVEMYTYADGCVHDKYRELARVSGNTPVLVDKKASFTVDGKVYEQMKHWSTDENAVESSGDHALAGAEPITEVPVPASWSDYLVGFGRADITPVESVPLAGYGYTSERMSDGVLSEIKATAVIVTDKNGESVCIVAMDLINDRGNIAPYIRSGISEKIGIPADHVYVNFSHTHSGPDLDNMSATSYMREYREYVISQAVAAGEAAWKDRKAAEMHVGVTAIEGYNFVRHYVRADGSISTPAYRPKDNPAVAHVGDADPTMRLIRFTREGYEDVVLMNWQNHASVVTYLRTGHDDYTKVAADYIDGVRSYMEKKLDCKFIYVQGAGGDLLTYSEVAGENKTNDPELYGKRLADAAIACLNSGMTKNDSGLIKVYNFEYDGPVNHADEHLLDKARELKAMGGKPTAEQCMELGLISRHHATTIIRCAGLGDTIPVPCAVFSVGNIGFACAPFEVFSDTGLEILASSPFDQSFMIAYCNDSQGYLPTKRAYDYDSYEEACTNFAYGTAEALAAEFAAKWSELKK